MSKAKEERRLRKELRGGAGESFFSDEVRLSTNLPQLLKYEQSLHTVQAFLSLVL